jgi:TonB family protein
MKQSFTVLLLCGLVASQAFATVTARKNRYADDCRPKGFRGVNFADDAAAAETDAVPISNVGPQNPEVARKAHIAGVVIVECTTNKSGDVTDVHVTTMPFGLDQAVVDAVKRWKFKPATLKGQPFDVTH